MVAKTINFTSLRENNAVKKPGDLNIGNVIDPGEVTSIINHNKDITKAQNEKSIGYVAKEG